MSHSHTLLPAHVLPPQAAPFPGHLELIPHLLRGSNDEQPHEAPPPHAGPFGRLAIQNPLQFFEDKAGSGEHVFGHLLSVEDWKVVEIFTVAVRNRTR